MPADTDHIRRDALHAARSEVRVLVGKFIRRMDSEAKAHIEGRLAELDGEVDGTAIGREAAEAAIRNYLGDGEPREAIEAHAVDADELSPAAVL